MNPKDIDFYPYSLQRSCPGGSHQDISGNRLASATFDDIARINLQPVQPNENNHHKIWLGSSPLDIKYVRENLEESFNPETLPHKINYVWIDHSPTQQEIEFAQQNNFNFIDATKLPESFFDVELENRQVVNLKHYIFRDQVELWPDYARQSDILRLLILRQFAGSYSDCDEVISESLDKRLTKNAEKDPFVSVAKNNNCYIFSKLNSQGVLLMLREVAKRLENGYAKFLENQIYARATDPITKREFFTIFATGPEIAKQVLGEHNRVAGEQICCGSWFRGSILKRIESLQSELRQSDVLDRIRESMYQEAMLKMNKCNFLKYQLVLEKYFQLDSTQSLSMVKNVFEQVKKDVVNWTPTVISKEVDVDTLSDKNFITYIKYKLISSEGLSDQEKSRLFQFFSTPDRFSLTCIRITKILIKYSTVKQLKIFGGENPNFLQMLNYFNTKNLSELLQRDDDFFDYVIKQFPILGEQVWGFSVRSELSSLKLYSTDHSLGDTVLSIRNSLKDKGLLSS